VDMDWRTIDHYFIEGSVDTTGSVVFESYNLMDFPDDP
jgi:hypothetical protein